MKDSGTVVSVASASRKGMNKAIMSTPTAVPILMFKQKRKATSACMCSPMVASAVNRSKRKRSLKATTIAVSAMLLSTARKIWTSAHAQAEGDHPPPGECHCGHVFTENDQHGHCPACDEALDGDADWQDHCNSNPDHCGPPPAGSECHCGHVFTENDQHGHCPACDEALDGDADWEDHCSSNPDHCGPPPGGEEGHHDDPSFGDVDTDGDGDISEEEAQAAFGEDPNWLEEFERHDTNDDGVVTEDEFYGCAPDEAFDANCGAICAGMDTYVLDTDDDCIADSDPYATWDEPLCKCPEDDDGH